MGAELQQSLVALRRLEPCAVLQGSRACLWHMKLMFFATTRQFLAPAGSHCTCPAAPALLPLIQSECGCKPANTAHLALHLSWWAALGEAMGSCRGGPCSCLPARSEYRGFC